MKEIPINILHERLHYDPQTGNLVWKHNTQWTKSGQIAGCKSHGYIKIGIEKMMIAAHRIVWAMNHGNWPFGEIDHINGDRADNRIENLREVTHQQNCFNRSKAANNRSGYKGVSWHAEGKKWQAHISVGGKGIYLGLFETAEEAHEAYKTAVDRAYGVFAKHQYFPSSWNL